MFELLNDVHCFFTFLNLLLFLVNTINNNICIYNYKILTEIIRIKVTNKSTWHFHQLTI